MTDINLADQRCENCIYYRFAINGDGTVNYKQSQCKRFPATPMLIPENNGVALRNIRTGPPKTDWCGEWKPKEVN